MKLDLNLELLWHETGALENIIWKLTGIYKQRCVNNIHQWKYSNLRDLVCVPCKRSDKNRPREIFCTGALNQFTRHTRDFFQLLWIKRVSYQFSCKTDVLNHCISRFPCQVLWCRYSKWTGMDYFVIRACSSLVCVWYKCTRVTQVPVYCLSFVNNEFRPTHASRFFGWQIHVSAEKKTQIKVDSYRFFCFEL